jgi:hypothetical protein
LLRESKDFLLINFRRPAAFDNELAVDDDDVDAVAVFAEDQLAHDIV